MEVLPLVRTLWRRRMLLASGAIVAIAVAFSVGPPPEAPSVVAWTRVGLDTPKSQLVASAPAGADTLPWRASLLVHLMNTDEVHRQIADRLRVRSDEVAVVDSILAKPLFPASMPTSAAEAAAFTAAPYVLTVETKNLSLPVISIEAAAPDRAGAARLAEAAVAVLEAQSSTSETRIKSPILTGGGTATSTTQTYFLRTQPYLVRRVAQIRTKPVAASTLPTTRIGISFLLFGTWCAGVMLLPPLLRRRSPRAATA